MLHGKMKKKSNKDNRMVKKIVTGTFFSEMKYIKYTII